MYKIKFYADSTGNEPVREYLQELKKKAKTDKNARIQHGKISDYINILEEKGTRAGSDVTKYLGGDIWELRPLDNRILFFCWSGDVLVLLHHFKKTTQKTPKREMETAKKRMKEILSEGENGSNK